MVARFVRSGLQFQYPDNWQLEQDDTESGWTVHVQSPRAAFLEVYFNEDKPSPEHVLQTTLDALRAEYTDLESEDHIDSVAGLPAKGHEVHFTCLDLTNTCWMRSFFMERGTVLVMWQSVDLDLDDIEPVMQAICASMATGDV